MVSIIALFAIVFALNTVMASDMVSDVTVKINDVVASETSPVAGFVSSTVPVEVQFTAAYDVSDVRVRVYIEGYKDEVYEITPRFHIVNGSRYIESFSLKLPSTMDLDDLTEGVTLYVTISAKGEDSVEREYAIEMQRDLYSLDILSIEAPETAAAGSTIAIDVVLQNNGNERLDNTYVKASIPGLGIERRVYFGDLVSTEDEDENDLDDSVNKKIYLTLPRNAASGVYNIELEAYNYDTSTTAKKKLVVSDVETGILPSLSTKTVSVGQETSFDVVLVNPNDKMVVYTLTPEQSEGLTINVEEPVVAVSAGSSKTVKVDVKATNSAAEGSHTITIDVTSDSGLVKKVNFNLNVEKSATTTGNLPAGNNVVLILTVILVIIFVVLLVVLIVLLTKKPAESEEFGETSYY
ncbi:MAG: FixG Ig-like domain-containing protein [Candidatus Nanoarchaeia archaeon]|nr:FixG Ig-like domain-containing protein [Candidatus Nanoarchaeia archaeon]